MTNKTKVTDDAFDIGRLASAHGSESDNRHDDNTTYEFDKKALQSFAEAYHQSASQHYERDMANLQLNIKAQEELGYALTAQVNQLRDALEDVRKTLQNENYNENGAIQDTIWHSAGETLFDFIDSAITATSTQSLQTHEEKQNDKQN